MGTVTLDARLRARLVLVLAPTLSVVAIAAVAVTARALDTADDGRARGIARSVVERMRAELAEGDSFSAATREVVSSLDPREIRVAIDGGSAEGPLGALAVDECAAIELEETGPWRGCKVVSDGLTVAVGVRTDDHRRALRSLAEWMVGVVALALVASVWATRAALRSPLESLAKLVAWADQVPVGAASSPPHDDTVEIEKLSRSFQGLVTELTEALAREKANSAHIAHELRTPLTAIVAEAAAMPPSEAVARLRDDASRLARVIDAISILSEPRSAKRAETVVNVADLVRSLAPSSAKVEAPDEALVEADPHLLELAIINLLDNAKKYAAETALCLRVAQESDKVRVSVIDGGPGLPPGFRDRAFDRYWRQAHDGQGRGLGLALVRAVAERHGGTASARAGDGDRGADVGFSVGPVLAWHG